MEGPGRQVEFTTDSVRQQRKDHREDILQPFRSGVPSREFMEAYPEKTKHWSEEMRKKAKYVWKDT